MNPWQVPAMSFQAWAASWSAYTIATSGRIVPSSSSCAILPSTSPDGVSLIITPDTTVLRGLFLRYGLGGSDEMAAFLQDEERPVLCIATDQSKTTSTFSRRTFSNCAFSIIDDPAAPRS